MEVEVEGSVTRESTEDCLERGWTPFLLNMNMSQTLASPPATGGQLVDVGRGMLDWRARSPATLWQKC